MSSGSSLVNVKDTAHNFLVLEILPDFYQAERHVDVTFHCKDGVKVKAHRLLLGSVSPLFKHLFEEQGSRDMVDVVLPDFDSSDLDNLLRFIYEGLIRLEEREIKHFRQLLKMFVLRIPAVITQFSKNSSLEEEQEVVEELEQAVGANINVQAPEQGEPKSLSLQKSATSKRKLAVCSEISSKIARIDADLNLAKELDPGGSKTDREAIINTFNNIIDKMSSKNAKSNDNSQETSNEKGRPVIAPLKHFKTAVMTLEKRKAEKKLEILVNEAVLNCFRAEKKTLAGSILKKLSDKLMKQNIDQRCTKVAEAEPSSEKPEHIITSAASAQLKRDCSQMINSSLNQSLTISGSMSENDSLKMHHGISYDGRKEAELSKCVESSVRSTRLSAEKLRPQPASNNGPNQQKSSQNNKGGTSLMETTPPPLQTIQQRSKPNPKRSGSPSVAPPALVKQLNTKNDPKSFGTSPLPMRQYGIPNPQSTGTSLKKLAPAPNAKFPSLKVTPQQNVGSGEDENNQMLHQTTLPSMQQSAVKGTTARSAPPTPCTPVTSQSAQWQQSSSSVPKSYGTQKPKINIPFSKVSPEKPLQEIYGDKANRATRPISQLSGPSSSKYEPPVILYKIPHIIGPSQVKKTLQQLRMKPHTNNTAAPSPSGPAASQRKIAPAAGPAAPSPSGPAASQRKIAPAAGPAALPPSGPAASQRKIAPAAGPAAPPPGTGSAHIRVQAKHISPAQPPMGLGYVQLKGTDGQPIGYVRQCVIFPEQGSSASGDPHAPIKGGMNP